jgi:phosphoenolpyruvate carboxykinase (ATP)
VELHLSYDEIAKHEADNEEGLFASNGTFVCETGIFTGRSPKDKYFVEQGPSKDEIWW